MCSSDLSRPNFIAVHCDYARPLLATIHLNYAQMPERHEYEIVGDEAWALYDFNTGRLRIGRRAAAAETTEDFPVERDPMYAAEHEAFLAAAEEHHGRPLDVLVGNAGVMPTGAFLDQHEDLDALTIDVNVHGLVHGMRAALPGMVERGRGHVVNVCSLAGKFPVKGLAVYNASKFAAVGLTAATRLEMDRTGVSISAVLPSAVRTELSAGIDYGPLPAVDPDDVARAIVRTVRTRAAETAVPGYVGTAQLASTLLPEPVMRLMRAAVRDDRAITATDSSVRGRYLERITRG